MARNSQLVAIAAAAAAAGSQQLLEAKSNKRSRQTQSKSKGGSQRKKEVSIQVKRKTSFDLIIIITIISGSRSSRARTCNCSPNYWHKAQRKSKRKGAFVKGIARVDTKTAKSAKLTVQYIRQTGETFFSPSNELGLSPNQLTGFFNTNAHASCRLIARNFDGPSKVIQCRTRIINQLNIHHYSSYTRRRSLKSNLFKYPHGDKSAERQQQLEQLLLKPAVCLVYSSQDRSELSKVDRNEFEVNYVFI